MTGRVLMSPPDVGELEEEYVLRALRSGWVAPTGPEVTAFEQEIAVRAGVAHAVAMSSGTAALHLAMVAMGVQPGDVVIVATMTFVASANAVAYTGAQPCFVDVEAEGNLDPHLLDRAITEQRSQGDAYQRRHGRSICLGRWRTTTRSPRVCEKHDVPLHRGRCRGARGVVPRTSCWAASVRPSALSFNGNKIMTTSGGGMLRLGRRVHSPIMPVS